MKQIESERSAGGSVQRLWQFGDLKIDGIRYITRLEGRVVPLTRLEFDLLERLVTTDGVVTYEELVREVIGAIYGGESSLIRVHLTNIRRKLGRAAIAIRTVRGRGVWFDGNAIQDALSAAADFSGSDLPLDGAKISKAD